jgi:hypothetical protein
VIVFEAAEVILAEAFNKISQAACPEVVFKY